MIPHPRRDEPLPTFITHWTSRRKAVLVEAVKSKKISLEEACERFDLSREEFHSWVASLERYGTPGLRSTRYQIYRAYP
jgi:hypothetical protein